MDTNGLIKENKFLRLHFGCNFQRCRLQHFVHAANGHRRKREVVGRVVCAFNDGCCWGFSVPVQRDPQQDNRADKCKDAQDDPKPSLEGMIFLPYRVPIAMKARHFAELVHFINQPFFKNLPSRFSWD